MSQCASVDFSPTQVQEPIFYNKIAITLSCASPTPTIYYTLDGTTPTASSLVYSVPIIITYTTVITAFATSSGLDDSAVTSQTYIKNTIPTTQIDTYPINMFNSLITKLKVEVALPNRIIIGTPTVIKSGNFINYAENYGLDCTPMSNILVNNSVSINNDYETVQKRVSSSTLATANLAHIELYYPYNLSTYDEFDYNLVSIVSNNTVDSASTGFFITKDEFTNDINDLLQDSNVIYKGDIPAGKKLFLYDNKGQTSLINGSFDVDSTSNIENLFYIYKDREIRYIIDMKETISEFTGATIAIAEANIFSVKVNGRNLESTDWTFSSGTLEIITTKYLKYSNYAQVLSYADQSSGTLSGVYITLYYKGYEQDLIIDSNQINSIPNLTLKKSLSVSPSYEFYEKKNKASKQRDKTLIGKNSKLTLSYNIATNNLNVSQITDDLKYYMFNQTTFRLIAYVEKFGCYIYFNGCKVNEPKNFKDENEVSSLEYNIDFQNQTTVSFQDGLGLVQLSND